MQKVRGFYDLIGEEAEKYRFISDAARGVLNLYNFEEIILPVVEFRELFERSVGEATDIVQKEMFSFEDRKGRKLVLRPEGTASAVRAFIENKLYAQRPYVKLFYEGPMFRYERPQAGRRRQFHQIGAEVFGEERPHADAELIKTAYDVLNRLGVKTTLEINSLGCKEDRKAYAEALRTYLKEKESELCPDCLRRKERNPLRVLDCKNESCKQATRDAPLITDYLCTDCREHYETVKNYLKALGVPFVENPRLVRGLDYYTRTVFEFTSDELGLTVCAGGRYDHLVEELGGPPTPALGFALGVERLMQLVKLPEKEKDVYFVVPFGDKEVFTYALKVADALRREGKRVELSYRKGGLKKQLEFADRMGYRYAVIVGEDELKEGLVTLKDLKTGEQRKVKVI
ncbi:MAG: histidine--tRNA ligase [Aquificae bacterium]|nr:histidine--tRNA ligase [Aquificota bacterium]